LKQRKIEVFVTLDEEGLGNWRKDVSPVSRNALDEWLRYVEVLVERYKGRVKTWEIMNEPPLNENYAMLVIEASKLIRKLDPEAVVLAGSLARMDAKGLELILGEGIAPHIDVITFHPYCEFPEAIKHPFIRPVKKPENYFMASNRLADLRDLLDRYDRNIELWQGECGYPSAANSSSWQGRGPWGENIQAKWLARRFLTDLSLGLPVSVYFLLRVPPEEERFNEKGLLRFKTWEPKPAYQTLQHITAIFDQDLNTPVEIRADLEVVDQGCFLGIRGDYPDSFGTPYANAKAPTPVEVISVTGSKGNAVVYWLPWRMQEIVQPAFINMKIGDIDVKEPVMVDLLSGKIYPVKYKIENSSMKFVRIPLADYPMVILEKDSVTFD
jgi:hypothetical protein